MISTKRRSNEKEIMDDFDMEGELLISTLDQIAKINNVLGGNNVTINGIKKMLSNQPKEKTIVIVDLGCGNGDMLRAIADFARKKGYKIELQGIDANLATINYAKELSKEYPEITYLKQDILADDYDGITCDIVLSTLFLHHFTDEESVALLTTFFKKARLGIIVNDLHRNKLAYILFWLICRFIKNRMVRNDGLISILRGFKRNDLNEMSKKLEVTPFIKWKWAFRFQWLIQK